MLKRYCDRCNSEMSESVLTHEGISQGVFVSISIDGDRDYCEDCLEKAIQAAIRTLAGEEQETTQVVGLAPIVLAAPQEKPVRQPKPKARPAAEPKPEKSAALPDAPEGARWMTLAEVVGDSGLNGETVRTRLHSMGCAEQVMPRGRTRLYCVTPEQLAAAVSHASHPGMKTSSEPIPDGWYTLTRLADMAGVSKVTMTSLAKRLGVESRHEGQMLIYHPTDGQLARLMKPRECFHTPAPESPSAESNGKRVLPSEQFEKSAENMRRAPIPKAAKKQMGDEERNKVNAAASNRALPEDMAATGAAQTSSETVLKLLCEAELTGALPKGSECPAGERDSAKDHAAEFQRKLAALREHESARHLLTINGYLGVPRVGAGEKPLTVDIVAPNGREKTFLIDSIAESEVAI